MRCVLYDAASPAAATAAALLADEFDVQPWVATRAEDSVVLVTHPGAASPGPRTRLVGVVDAAALGHGPGARRMRSTRCGTSSARAALDGVLLDFFIDARVFERTHRR